MPDMVQQILEVLPERSGKKIIESLMTDETYLDFNKIIPMPEHQPDLTKPNAFWADGNISMKVVREFEENNWLKWSMKNWGTKWNACDVEKITSNKLVFDTPYAPVFPVIKALSKKYPNNTFILICKHNVFSTDHNSFTMSSLYTFKKGKLV
jgi:hypothetical protein